jgi:hypothetical protein
LDESHGVDQKQRALAAREGSGKGEKRKGEETVTRGWRRGKQRKGEEKEG